MHAQTFDAEEAIDVTRYWVSEKLDGVRAIKVNTCSLAAATP
jgi:hypothetical protein